MRVGFIGIGTMGAGMALNALKTGCDMVVHDLRKEAAAPHLAAGAKWADSVAEAAKGADVVFTSLPKPNDVEKVGLGENGLLGAMSPGSAWFDLSTNSPSTLRRVGEKFAGKGIHFLDAPVSGSRAGAISGRLAIYVGGDRAIFDKYEKLLKAIGDQAMHVGKLTAGTIAKLTHNCMSLSTRLAIAEAFAMGVKAGVEPLELWHALRQGVLGRNRPLDMMGAQFLVNKYEPPNFALELALKDMTLALELAGEVKVPMQVADLAFADMNEAVKRGWGREDSHSPMKLPLERAGVHLDESEERVKNTLARG